MAARISAVLSKAPIASPGFEALKSPSVNIVIS